LWQAEYWISEARNHALALACHHRGLEISNDRGFDQLPSEVLKPFAETLLGELSRDRLLKALDRTVDGLLLNSQDVREVALKLEPQLRRLVSEVPEATD
jgi:hypothetical protein